MRQRYLEAALLSPSSEGPYYKLWDIARKRKQYRVFERDMRTILDRH